MSKMGKLYLESEREEIAFNNSLCKDEHENFLDYTIRDVLYFIAQAIAGLFVVLVLWVLTILVLI
tara:strand:- start:464 stop:658 length:195 start_codon:yes stop_codon:yes gene_type:complete